MSNSTQSSGLGRCIALTAALIATACTQSDADTERRVKPSQQPTSIPAPSGSTAPPRETGLTWTGCDISRKAYITAAVAEYEKQTGREVTVTGGGATRGIRATVGGASDVGGSCRHTLAEQYPAGEGDAVLTVVGWDALVFFTHEDNPVDGISKQQARDILLGNITNWNEVGGPDAKIVPVFRQQTVSGKQSGVGYMTRLLLFETPDTEYTENAIFFVSSGPVEEYVENTPFSIAVTGVSSAGKRDVKQLALEGVRATKENIASGAYKLFRPLYLVTKGEPTGRAKHFIDWMLGEEGQATLSREGTVNREEGEKLFALFQWPDKGSSRDD